MAIVRTAKHAKGGITEAERAALGKVAEEWIAIARRTAPIEPAKIVPAIHSLYAAAKLPKPKVVLVASPRLMAFSGTVLSGVWEARGAGVAEAEIEAARQEACSFLDGHGPAPKSALAKKWIASLPDWWRAFQGGNMWAGFPAYVSGCRDVLGLRLPEFEAWQSWEDCARHGSYRYMGARFCVVSDFPEILKYDEQNRPHCATGPSHRWRDGWEFYYWHGVRVPAKVVMAPETITLEDITEEKNAEVRRVLIERFGEDRYITESGMPAVHHDERFGTLYVDENLGLAKVRVVNRTAEPDGTFRVYWLSVDPTRYGGAAGKNAQAAVASTWRTAPGGGDLAFERWEDYAPEAES